MAAHLAADGVASRRVHEAMLMPIVMPIVADAFNIIECMPSIVEETGDSDEDFELKPTTDGASGRTASSTAPRRSARI